MKDKQGTELLAHPNDLEDFEWPEAIEFEVTHSFLTIDQHIF